MYGLTYNFNNVEEIVEEADCGVGAGKSFVDAILRRDQEPQQDHWVDQRWIQKV